MEMFMFYYFPSSETRGGYRYPNNSPWVDMNKNIVMVINVLK